MEQINTIFKSLYEDFLLRDFFAKVVPGITVLASLYSVFFHESSLLNSDFGYANYKLLITLLVIGIAWIVGYAVQALGELTIFGTASIIHQRPSKYNNDYERYNLRQKFKIIATDKENKQVERYALIKEATGNFSTALIVSLLLFTIHRLTHPYSNKLISILYQKELYLGLVIIAIILLLMKANRSHSHKEYKYMVNVVGENKDPLPNIEAIAFDFDGVIADSMPTQAKAWESAIESLPNTSKLSNVQHAILMKNFWKGHSGERMFIGLQASVSQKRKLRSEKDKIWKPVRTDTSPVSGVKEAIIKLSQKVKLCIATTAPLEYVDAVLKKAEIRDYFSVIMTDDDVKEPKPASEMLLKLSSYLGVEPSNMLMIGDTETDDIMAQVSGTEFIHFTTQKNLHTISTFSNWNDLVEHILPALNHT